MISTIKKLFKKAALLLLFWSTFSFAQKEISISFGEKINLGKVDNDVHFYIKSAFGAEHIVGNQINEFIFVKPAIYKIKVVDKHKDDADNCAHNHLPDEIIIDVSNTKILFDAASILFSAPIRKNINTDGIVLSIEANIATFDHKPMNMSSKIVNSAGIGSSIVAELDSKFFKLNEGKHVLHYNLKGAVTENCYLMFDFVAENGTIQSAAISNPVID